MANITRRTNKDGSISYRIRVHVGTTSDGREKYQSMTWRPSPTTRPTAAEKEAARQATLFEEKCRQGLVSTDGKTRFATYADKWIETANIAPKTRQQYEYVLKRVNAAIGHIPLEQLRPDHLKAFYANLRESGVNQVAARAVSTKLDEARKAAGLSQDKLAELSGVSKASTNTACQGKAISLQSAAKLAAALDKPTTKLFDVKEGKDKLSDRTIRAHHAVIRSILSTATKERIISYNPAELVDAPKLPRGEARYLTDVEARQFLRALTAERDIRIKTALMLDLFTGARRGELCGLQWPDIDFDKGQIRIQRASQYIPKKGVVTLPTKTATSDRTISVPPMVLDLLREYKKWWVEHRLMWGPEWQGNEERLFIQDNGKPIFPDTINTWLKRFVELNNLPKITVHSLRHTFATLQIASGVDIRTLQARTGHSQASTLLNVYSHSIESAEKNAALALESTLLDDADHA